MKKGNIETLPLELKNFLDHQFQSNYTFQPLPLSGSSRRYFRIFDDKQSYIAAYNTKIFENEVFLSFTQHFRNKNFPVPFLYAVAKDKKSYLLQDLGDKTLASILPSDGLTNHNQVVINYYKKALEDLIQFQLEGGEGYEWRYSYPIDEMNETSILWDLNYFKYYFLHLSGLDYNEYELEGYFKDFINILLQYNRENLMFRDFQSRNIMILEDKLYYIDYQGARKGFMTYDIVSLLFQAKAKIDESLRIDLFNYYLNQLSKKVNVDKVLMQQEFYHVALLRNLQTLGAYGFRGLIQHKPHFVKSISSALDNLQYLTQKLKNDEQLSPFLNLLDNLITHVQNHKITKAC